MGELKFIYIGSLLVLFGGWKTLFEKDELNGIYGSDLLFSHTSTFLDLN